MCMRETEARGFITKEKGVEGRAGRVCRGRGEGMMAGD